YSHHTSAHRSHWYMSSWSYLSDSDDIHYLHPFPTRRSSDLFHIYTVMMIVITVISNFLNTVVFYVSELFSFITIVICSNQKTFIHMPKVFHILFFFCYLN